MKRASIKFRILVLVNAIAVCVGIGVGLASLRIVDRTIEQRLIREPVKNMAELVEQLNLPVTDRLMRQLSRIMDSEMVAVSGAQNIVGSSLSSGNRSLLRRKLRAGPRDDVLHIAGRTFHLGRSPLGPKVRSPNAESDKELALLLLLPGKRLSAAKRTAFANVAVTTALTILVASAVGYWLSGTIVGPIRTLADRMDRAFRGEKGVSADGQIDANDGNESAEERPAAPTGPAEVVRLAGSFHELLDRLDTVHGRLAQSAKLAGVGQLSVAMAHELRNPLSGIKMNARVMADELEVSGADTRTADHIIREIDRIDMYLQELLHMRSDTGAEQGPFSAAQMRSKPVDLHNMTESVVHLLHHRLEHTGVHFSNEINAGDATVRADPERLRQVFLNLLLNAVDAAYKRDRPCVRVFTTPGLATDSVCFCVADNGPGIAPRAESQLFEPFTSTKPEGTGLGLYICRQIVEALEGNIRYERNENETVFRVELPGAER